MTDPTPLNPNHAHVARPSDDAAELAQARAQADGRDLAPDVAIGSADEASRFATHGDPTLTRTVTAAEAARRAGAQWVRPTDLAARAGGKIIDHGTKWNTQLHDAVLAGIRDARAGLQERLARRQNDLEPTSPTTGRAVRPVAGRTGVSL